MENSAKAEEHEKIFHKEAKISLDSEAESSFIINENIQPPETGSFCRGSYLWASKHTKKEKKWSLRMIL